MELVRSGCCCSWEILSKLSVSRKRFLMSVSSSWDPVMSCVALLSPLSFNLLAALILSLSAFSSTTTSELKKLQYFYLSSTKNVSFFQLMTESFWNCKNDQKLLNFTNFNKMFQFKLNFNKVLKITFVILSRFSVEKKRKLFATTLFRFLVSR